MKPPDRKGTSTPPAAIADRPPWPLVVSVVTGTMLNPLNSSMIAVALLGLSMDFRISISTATWLISGFYLGGAVGMPLMGRMADLFGPRRVFGLGLALVGLTGAVAPLAPSAGWLLAVRVVQAFGTAAPYPAGLAMIRARDRRGRAPAAALGAITIAASVSAALGPILGGVLVALAGWRAIFLFNVPVVVVGLVMAWMWLPPDRPPPLSSFGTVARSRWASLHRLDVLGVGLFGGVMAGLLTFLLSVSSRPLWPLLALAVLAAVLLIGHESRTDTPFLDVRLLAANRPLVGVYAQFLAVSLAFYAIFFGLPLWLEEARRFGPGATGLLLMPLAAVGVLVTPIATRVIERSGPRPSLILGSALLLAGALALLLVGGATPIPVLLAVAVLLGVPNGLNNLGLQAALYDAAPAASMGTASGLFQTFRFTGAILSTAVIGVALGQGATSEGLHTLAAVIAAVSALLLVASIRMGR